MTGRVLRVLRILPVLAALTMPRVAAQSAQSVLSTDLPTAIRRLADLDYATRMNAARAIRRVPSREAAGALTVAIRDSDDQFVRYRALVLLTGFNDRNTNDLVRSLLGDRNDRVREVAYRWLEWHPDRSAKGVLLAALGNEQAEFVRPALVRALAALDDDVQVQRALITEAGRGLDFFRVTVIEALGLRKARYAVDTLIAVARLDGPLQDDAVIALGRIGDRRAMPQLESLPAEGSEVAMAVHAARCLFGEDCEGHTAALRDALTARRSSREVARSAATALGVLAASSDAALDALAATAAGAQGAARDEAVIAFGGVALRDPDRVMTWLSAGSPERQPQFVGVLREAFERFEEDLAEEQFFAATRAAYWKAAEGSATRMLTAMLIERLDF